MLTIKDLVAPVTNRVHLVTIIVVASIFAWFRLSGGQIYSAPNTAPARSSSGYAREIQDSSGAEFQARIPQRAESAAAPRESNSNDNDFLAELDARRAGNSGSAARTAEPKSKEPTSNLDDIERTLGMR